MTETTLDAFGDDLDCVIADPIKFKLKLRIGEEAYAILRLKNGLQSLWDVGGVAMTGASAAASKVVAGTLFASSAGMFSAFGIGAAAATPVGWVLAAALTAGGAYYGVTRLVRTKTSQMVDTIPRFINTPIDLLGIQLFDLIGALAMRVASIDGKIDPAEAETINRHFVDDWGYHPVFVTRGLDLLAEGTLDARVKAIAKDLAEFQAKNPDCNAEAMQTELLNFLKDVVTADGILDEREDLAVDAIAATFRQARALTVDKLGRSISGVGEQAGSALSGLKNKIAVPINISQPKIGQ